MVKLFYYDIETTSDTWVTAFNIETEIVQKFVAKKVHKG